LVISLRGGGEFAETEWTGVVPVQWVAPVIQQSAVYAQFAGKPKDVVARLHSLDGLVPKFLTVAFPPFSVPFCSPFRAKCVHHETVSLQGFTPV
jgi:hypothetical protein